MFSLFFLLVFSSSIFVYHYLSLFVQMSYWLRIALSDVQQKWPLLKPITVLLHNIISFCLGVMKMPSCSQPTTNNVDNLTKVFKTIKVIFCSVKIHFILQFLLLWLSIAFAHCENNVLCPLCPSHLQYRYFHHPLLFWSNPKLKTVEPFLKQKDPKIKFKMSRHGSNFKTRPV